MTDEEKQIRIAENLKKLEARALRLAKLRESEPIRIKALTNKEVLDEYLELLPGDDYEGCFTREGQITIGILSDEFDKRLNESNYLTLR